jgi:hypothetical protein
MLDRLLRKRAWRSDLVIRDGCDRQQIQNRRMCALIRMDLSRYVRGDEQGWRSTRRLWKCPDGWIVVPMKYTGRDGVDGEERAMMIAQ